MNKDLLFQLYSIHSPSNHEKKMRKFVKRYIKRVCGTCGVKQDEFGNVFITKGESDSYPCLAAHLDQVQDDHAYDFEVVEGKDVVFGYSASMRQQQGLGADDKNGIYICLECLAKYDVLKVAFFVGEEIGCKGSRACKLDFFKDCKYIIEPDRMGGDDLITSMSVGKVCSDDFVDALRAEVYGYSPERGSITDVGELVERGVGISCLNLSCGYYNAHTDEEFTVLSELENCFNLVCNAIETLTEKSYPFEYVGYSYPNYGRYVGYGSYSRSWDDSWRNKSSAVVTKPFMPAAARSKDYLQEDYDEDMDMMQILLDYTPDMEFDEIVGAGGYLCNFNTKDIDILRDIYEDVKKSLGLDYKNGLSDYWDDDDDKYSFDDVMLRAS